MAIEITFPLIYMRLDPDGSPQSDIAVQKPFVAVVVIREDVTPEWQRQCSEWLVESGCLFMVAWGPKCSTWDDAVDFANIHQFWPGEIPDDRFVMTTWHENESLEEAVRFAKRHARHPSVALESAVLIEIAKDGDEEVLRRRWLSA